MARKKIPWLWLGAGAAGVALLYWKKAGEQSQAQVQTVARMAATAPKAQGNYFSLG